MKMNLYGRKWQRAAPGARQKSRWIKGRGQPEACGALVFSCPVSKPGYTFCCMILLSCNQDERNPTYIPYTSHNYDLHPLQSISYNLIYVPELQISDNHPRLWALCHLPRKLHILINTAGAGNSNHYEEKKRGAFSGPSSIRHCGKAIGRKDHLLPQGQAI